jgi:hypothetical protein
LSIVLAEKVKRNTIEKTGTKERLFTFLCAGSCSGYLLQVLMKHFRPVKTHRKHDASADEESACQKGRRFMLQFPAQ